MFSAEHKQITGERHSFEGRKLHQENKDIQNIEILVKNTEKIISQLQNLKFFRLEIISIQPKLKKKKKVLKEGNREFNNVS